MYDPGTGLYHMMYQWHYNHVNWGEIAPLLDCIWAHG